MPRVIRLQSDSNEHDRPWRVALDRDRDVACVGVQIESERNGIYPGRPGKNVAGMVKRDAIATSRAIRSPGCSVAATLPHNPPHHSI